MKLPVVNKENKKVSETHISDEIILKKTRTDLVQRLIVWQLAKRRAGTHKTKTRGEITASNRKIVKQKGTGGARHGSVKANIFRGGGKAFGPVVRSHQIKMPKKMRRLALKHAINAKINQGEFVVIENINVDTHKTKEFCKFIQLFETKSALIVASNKIEDNFRKAIRNIPYINAIKIEGINAYDIIKNQKILVEVDALKELERRIL